MEPMRLQKWIAQLGVASRREAERWIEAGRVCLDGQIVTVLGTKIDPDVQVLSIDGEVLTRKDSPPRVYWMLNKPDQILTSRMRSEGMRTFYDLPAFKNLPFLVSPVGRLDFRTEGLLLLSNDGEWIQRMTHPKYKVPRHYAVLVSRRLSDQAEKVIRSGKIRLDDGPVEKMPLRFLQTTPLGGSRGSWYGLTVHEGRNRLVRRIFEEVGYHVVRLVRTGYGNIKLPPHLKPGEYRSLTKIEKKLPGKW